MRVSLWPSRMFHSAQRLRNFCQRCIVLQAQADIAGQRHARRRIDEVAEARVLGLRRPCWFSTVVVKASARPDETASATSAADLNSTRVALGAILRSSSSSDVPGHDGDLDARLVVVGPHLAVEVRVVHRHPFDPVDRAGEVDGGGAQRRRLQARSSCRPCRPAATARPRRSRRPRPARSLTVELVGDVLAHLDHGADPFAARLVAQEVGRILEHAHAHLAGALDQVPGRFGLRLRARRNDARRPRAWRRRRPRQRYHDDG